MTSVTSIIEGLYIPYEHRAHETTRLFWIFLKSEISRLHLLQYTSVEVTPHRKRADMIIVNHRERSLDPLKPSLLKLGFGGIIGTPVRRFMNLNFYYLKELVEAENGTFVLVSDRCFIITPPHP